MHPEAEAWKPFSEDFDNKVFSFTQFEYYRKKIVENVPLGLVLNAGTGSTTHLNRDLIAKGNTVVATDFSQSMLDEAKKKFTDSRLHYLLSDTRTLATADKQFDSVVAINSILPANPDDVHTMLKELHRVAKPGAKFVGVFPSYQWHERAALQGKLKMQIDPKWKRVGDTAGWQTCQSTETLAAALKSAGFDQINIEEVFLNTPEEKRQLLALYGVDADEFNISEYFVTALKPKLEAFSSSTG